jgi:gluconolactonase
MKLSNYSLNYPDLFRTGRMDVFGFLSHCRELGVAGASLHVRDLPDTSTPALKRVRRAYLEHGLSVSMVAVTTDFGVAPAEQERELAKAREALHVARFLGAPLLRVFAGRPPSQMERDAAFARAAQSVRKLSDEAEPFGLAIGLQNHNHQQLCRTGEEVLRFIRTVNHDNLVFVLDTGQFAGSPGASGDPTPANADYLESIRQTAPLARYVRAKFYSPRSDGSEPVLDYETIFNILRGVHYQGFVDVVYEPQILGEQARVDVREDLSRIVGFLRTMTAGAAAAAQRTAPSSDRYQRLSNSAWFSRAQVATETAVAFTEGPAVDRAGNVFFSNIPMEQILKWEPTRKRLIVFRHPSNRSNGLAFDRAGRLLACEGIGRVTRTDMRTGEVTVLADNYQGAPLGAPNDLDLDAQGRVYFTARFAEVIPPADGPNGVYRVDPDGRVTRLLGPPAIDMPNGIVISPDNQRLYLVDADGRANRARRIRVYDLRPDGSLANERLLYDFYPGRGGDGMAIDAQGNLYVAAGLHRTRGTSESLETRPGIHVISPEGKLLALVETPEDLITNCTFGGPDLRTLYVTCGKLLLSLETRIPGKPSYRPDG